MASFRRAQFLRLIILSATITLAAWYSRPANAAVKIAHLQSIIQLNCTGRLCTGKFAKSSATRRFNVTRIACLLNGPAGSALESAQVSVLQGTTFEFGTFLTKAHSSATGVHEAGDTVDIRVVGGRQITVNLFLESGAAVSGFCSETGTTELVQ